MVVSRGQYKLERNYEILLEPIDRLECWCSECLFDSLQEDLVGSQWRIEAREEQSGLRDGCT